MRGAWRGIRWRRKLFCVFQHEHEPQFPRAESDREFGSEEFHDELCLHAAPLQHRNCDIDNC